MNNKIPELNKPLEQIAQETGRSVEEIKEVFASLSKNEFDWSKVETSLMPCFDYDLPSFQEFGTNWGLVNHNERAMKHIGIESGQSREDILRQVTTPTKLSLSQSWKLKKFIKKLNKGGSLFTGKHIASLENAWPIAEFLSGQGLIFFMSRNRERVSFFCLSKDTTHEINKLWDTLRRVGEDDVVSMMKAVIKNLDKKFEKELLSLNEKLNTLQQKGESATNLFLFVFLICGVNHRNLMIV